MWKRLLQNKMAVVMIVILLMVALTGIFAPWIAPNDPYENDILNKFAGGSRQFPLGTDQLGRCILSRMIYGIRPTLFLSLVTMVGTIGLGTIMGLLAGYFRGPVEEVIMRAVDVMMSFPSQIMVFAVVALLGIDVRNVIMANVLIKWAWYARMIRTNVMKYRDRNFVLYSRCIGSGETFILTRHLLPSIASEMAVLATLDIGWAVLNISTLSFLGLGVKAPNSSWGTLIKEGADRMEVSPELLLFPALLFSATLLALNFLGDGLRDALDPKSSKD